MSQRGEAAAKDPVASLVAGYCPLPGVADEMLAGDGSLRPVWSELLRHIASLDRDELLLRRERGDQYLRDAGVFYRQYGATDAPERDWPLSHLPVLIDEAEWEKLSAGLIQRAELLERVVADLYGENTLVRDGWLPADLVAGSPEWLRPLVGVTPRSGRFLHFVAFDIGRGPSGDWWVMGDRTQAPSGAGFALENRVATARIYPELHAKAHVHRLAGFFRAFRDTLMDLRGRDESRVGILTPGPHNDTFFEQAYIARYLGFMLLEGEDLTVRDGILMVRTIAGPRPVSVLWRRLDAAWADPLELDERSQIGTPGLLSAVRSGSVTLVNALGSGVLETRALLAFLPRICEVLTGEPLRLPNIATWWCGQPAEREYVKANAHRMTIGNAFSTRLLFDSDDVSVTGGVVRGEFSDTLVNWIDHGGGRLVGQEAVTLSTSPAFEGDRLVPRPMSLRVFLTRTADGWSVMPGGFARIGRSADSAVLAMQQGGHAADVWIVSKRPVSTETMLASGSDGYARQQPAVLPARAADNLFWLGRYVERTEHMVRLLRAWHTRLAETAIPDSPLLDHLATLLLTFDADPAGGLPPGVGRTLQAASTAAGHVRDRFSVDGWLALSDLAKTIRGMERSAEPGADMARAMGILLRKLSGFSGLVHENMYRFTGWRFLGIGRSLERASCLAGLLERCADPAAPEGSLDLAVELADSAMTHRRRYAVATNRATVVDLLALDPLNPRAIMYQFDQIEEHVAFLPGNEPHRPLPPLRRALLEAQAALAGQTPDSLDTKRLAGLRVQIAGLSDHLANAYLR